MGEDFVLRLAEKADIDGIVHIMERAKETVGNPDWFVADDRGYIGRHVRGSGGAMETAGFTMIAETKNGQLAAFFTIDYPGVREGNLGYDIGLPKEECLRVVHMDTVGVLPEYRGNQVVMTKEKYGGLPRHILYKKAEAVLQRTQEAVSPSAHPAVLVSACLLGVNCRYNGKGVLEEPVKALMEKAVLIPVCPEILGGLATPRDPAERSGGRVLTINGADVTAAYEKGAMETLKLAQLYDCHYAILKERSPSCGSGRIYDGTHSKILTDGDGITAELLKKNGIQVFGESKTEDLERFL